MYICFVKYNASEALVFIKKKKSIFYKDVAPFLNSILSPDSVCHISRTQILWPSCCYCRCY